MESSPYPALDSLLQYILLHFLPLLLLFDIVLTIKRKAYSAFPYMRGKKTYQAQSVKPRVTSRDELKKEANRRKTRPSLGSTGDALYATLLTNTPKI